MEAEEQLLKPAPAAGTLRCGHRWRWRRRARGRSRGLRETRRDGVVDELRGEARGHATREETNGREDGRRSEAGGAKALVDIARCGAERVVARSGRR
jgi:hypothetical protein